MKFFFTLLTAILPFVFTISSFAIEADFSDYERDYPKYVDAKEPLSSIKSKDIRCFNAAKLALSAYSISAPITIRYYIDVKQQLDIYSMKPLDKLKPVIFFIHSGNEDKRSVLFSIPAWLRLGYLVVSINHRSVPENTFPEIVEDCNMALKWVMDYIQDYGGDPDRIAVTGISCGAHLSTLLVTDKTSQQKYGIDIRKVKCWFPMSGFYDMDLKENLISPTIKSYIEWICIPSKQAASPVALASGKEPPCLIIHGGDDWCVPKTNAVSLYSRLDKGKTTLAILKGYMHANVFYSYLNPDHEPAKLIKKFLATYLPTEENH